MRFENDLKRKPSFKDLNTKLNHLYNTNKEYERAVSNTVDLLKEQVGDTMRGENPEEQKDLSRILKQIGNQRDALLKNHVYELKRLYRYLETIKDKEIKFIFTLRHAHFLTWEQIADCIGDDLVARDVKAMHERFVIEVIQGAKETTQAM